MKKEKMEYAMNLLTSMVVRQEAYDKNEDCIKVFKQFRKSYTYDALFDPSTGLWMNGPDYILDDYRMEMSESWSDDGNIRRGEHKYEQIAGYHY